MSQISYFLLFIEKDLPIISGKCISIKMTERIKETLC